MTALSDANDALYGDDNIAVDATWRSGGAGDGTGVRIIRTAPDKAARFGQSHLVVATDVFDVRRSEVAAAAEGDTATLACGTVLTVIGTPMLDEERLNFTCEANRSA